MKRSSFVLLLIAALAPAGVFAQSLTLKWKSDTTLRCPESVLVDSKNNIIYVANINGKSDGKDGNGFISKLSADGKIISLEWAKGLDAPKGMGISRNTLYVADITKVVMIDLTSGKITGSVPVDGSIFLNDITVDSKGMVYVSDSNAGKVHMINGTTATVYIEGTDAKGPNGLLAQKDGLYLVDFPTGTNYKLSPAKALTKFTKTAEGADGIVSLGADGYLISSWYGEIDYVNAKGEVKKLLDTRDQKINSADIDYDAKTKTLYIPTFFANSVMAYEFRK